MNARPIGEIAFSQTQQKRARTHQPVWRNSYYRGQLEDRLYRPVADGTTRGARRYAGAVLRAARELETRSRRQRQAKEPGTRNGVLGEVGLEVLEILYKRFVNYATGRLDPAVATIADAVGRSYAAVHASLKRLRDAGFLHWLRRSVPTENESGPQIRQISNAYALDLPHHIKRMVQHLLGKSPQPDDDLWHRKQQRDEWDSMLATLNATDWFDTVVEIDGALGETLRSIAQQIDERESSSKRETRTVSL